jgi:hypothetical protein
MADINYSVSLRVEKDNLSVSIPPSPVTATMAAVGLQDNVYTLSGTPTNLPTATLTSVGIALLRNLSTATASTCRIGIVVSGTMHPFASPRPGEVAILRLSAGATYQATGTAGTRLRVTISEG